MSATFRRIRRRTTRRLARLVLGYMMPNIMIRCSIRGIPVPTRLTTEKIKFESLSGIVIPLDCPACSRVHQWQRKEAWVEKEG